MTEAKAGIPPPVKKEYISALILAAGRSSRMGEFKPLLTIDGKTLVEHAVENFRNVGVDDILVVTGYEAERLVPVLRRQCVRWVVNDDYDEGMFSSLLVGVSALADSCAGVFILPVDHPFVRPATLIALINAFRLNKKDKLIFRPSYQGRRGHPPLISADFIPAINSFKEAGGLRHLLSSHEEETLTVDCDDRGILVDLDSRDDCCMAAGKVPM
jgi:CTP:molybdopterin cytidylyltransferase MocA